MKGEAGAEKMPITNFKDLTERSQYGEQVRHVMGAFVPLALQLPQLRENPAMLEESVKATAVSGVTDVATKADLYMQGKLKEGLLVGHPDWQFWGEEGADNITEIDPTKRFLVAADPIEGTNNYKARKDNQWGSVVALVDTASQEPVVGVIALPMQKRFYVGVKGSGAFIVDYDDNGQVANFSVMPHEPEYPEFTYNASPQFEEHLVGRVKRFFEAGSVQPDSPDADDLDKSRKTVITQDGSTFVDLESGALEAVRNRGTIYFKTSNEMAAVFVIINELGGKVTDGEGKPWTMGINTLIAARNEADYNSLKTLYDRTAA